MRLRYHILSAIVVGSLLGLASIGLEMATTKKHGPMGCDFVKYQGKLLLENCEKLYSFPGATELYLSINWQAPDFRSGRRYCQLEELGYTTRMAVSVLRWERIPLVLKMDSCEPELEIVRLVRQAERENAEKIRSLFPQCFTFRPCVVWEEGSGENTYDYKDVAKSIRETPDITLVIDGVCDAECTVVASLAPSKVCVADHARFYFKQWYHLEYRPGHSKYRFEPEYPEPLKDWFAARGGLPATTDDLDEFDDDGSKNPDYVGPLEMDAEEAKAFWRSCRKDELPRNRFYRTAQSK